MLSLAAWEAFYRAKPKVLPGVVEVLLEHQGPKARTTSKAGLWATGFDQITVACHNLPPLSGVHFCSVCMERAKGP